MPSSRLGVAKDELTRDSNAVVDLVHEGKCDQAEQAARVLLEGYPEVHDGYDRLGMVYKVRAPAHGGRDSGVMADSIPAA